MNLAGRYIQAPSFATVIEEGVSIDANAVRRVDVRMQVAQLNQSVVVDASVSVLQADRADVSSQIESSQISQLPEPATRNFQSLLILVPGYAPPVSSHSEAGNPQAALATNVNGASYNNNNTKIEGTADLYPWLPEIAAYIPASEAIQTVNVVTASFDAEQGMAGGSVVNVFIKSGTNRYHGSAWEYNQISVLKARNTSITARTIPKIS